MLDDRFLNCMTAVVQEGQDEYLHVLRVVVQSTFHCSYAFSVAQNAPKGHGRPLYFYLPIDYLFLAQKTKKDEHEN